VTGQQPQSATAYVLGADGIAAIVPARVAAWLDSRLNLTQVRGQVRGRDAEVDAVLVALRLAAMSWRASATGSGEAPTPEVEASSWVGTRQAADLLGIGDRAIRLAIAEQRLAAHNVGGRWRITREDIEQFRAARRAA